MYINPFPFFVISDISIKFLNDGHDVDFYTVTGIEYIVINGRENDCFGVNCYT